jgi:hypothetical protein
LHVADAPTCVIGSRYSSGMSPSISSIDDSVDAASRTWTVASCAIGLVGVDATYAPEAIL